MIRCISDPARWPGRAPATRRAWSPAGPRRKPSVESEAVAAAADGDRLLQQLLEAGCKREVAGLNGILDVTQQVGQARLMAGRSPAHLGAKAVGDPELRPEFAEELRHHRFAPTPGRMREAGAVCVMEHPSPPGLLADAHTCLIRLQDAARQEPGSGSTSVWRAKAPQLSRSMLARAPSLISSPNRSDISRASRSNGIAWAKRRYSTKARKFAPERRAGLQLCRCRRLEPPRAARTGPAMQRHPGHVRHDLGDLDAVIGSWIGACPERHSHPLGNGRTAPPAHRAAASAWDAAAGAPLPWVLAFALSHCRHRWPCAPGSAASRN